MISDVSSNTFDEDCISHGTKERVLRTVHLARVVSHVFVADVWNDGTALLGIEPAIPNLRVINVLYLLIIINYNNYNKITRMDC